MLERLIIKHTRGQKNGDIIELLFRLTKSQKVYRYVSEGNVDVGETGDVYIPITSLVSF